MWKGHLLTLQRQYASACRLLNEKKPMVDETDGTIAAFTQ
jgi:hypothetical protein